MRKSNLVVTAACVLMGSLGGCGGGGGGNGGATFTTSVSGDKPLGTLTDGELATLCSDGAKFAANPTNKVDGCRLSAFLVTVFAAAFSPDATDSSLQMSCSDAYNQCLNPTVDGGAGSADGGAGSTCMRPPANCTATVAEYAACINDQAAQTHAAANAVPACSAVTLASVAPTDGGTTTTTQAQPASCQLAQAKCSGLSDTTKTFVDQYCALVAPCCTQAGLTSACASQVTSAAQQGTYDATAGAACLAALTALQAGANFCGGLVVSIGSSASWAVIPACASVFQSAGATPAGQPCTQSSDCAPGPNGGSVCLSDIVSGDGGTSTFIQTCQPLTGKVGDVCFGTAVYGGIGSYPGHPGAICDLNRGVFCDDQTFLCVAAYAPGMSCFSYDMCDPVTAYCNLSGANVCATRLPLGATCAGSLSGECDGNAICNSTTKKCTALAGAGAACSPSTFPSDCLSGFCNGGSCTSPLSPICQ